MGGRYMKKCYHCQQYKEDVEFNKNTKYKDGLDVWCKKCRYPYLKQRYEKYGWKNSLNSKYGPGASDIYERLFDEQWGNCAICGVSQKDLHRRLDLDHNHKTGCFRGLLCNRCNLLVGRLNLDDGVDYLQKILRYIEASDDCCNNR